MAVNGWLVGFSFIGGLLLGSVYFGGLWYTVKFMSQFRRPRVWWLLSFIVRLAMALGGLGILLKADLVVFFVALTAFFIVRFFIVKGIRPEPLKG